MTLLKQNSIYSNSLILSKGNVTNILKGGQIFKAILQFEL